MQAAARLQTGASCWIRRHASRIVPGSAWPVWRVLPRPLRGPVLGAAAASLARSVRPVGVVLITVAKGNSKGAQLMAKEWADKLRRYTQLTEVVVKPNPKNAKEPGVAMAHEAERVLRSVEPADHVVMLDERGRDVSSEDLAGLLAKASDQSWPRLVFAIGGPFGHGQEVRQRANESIRLSRMVLNHQVAHVVLLEQLYRAWTILRGEPYHH